MKLSYPHYLASQSFSKKFIRDYCTTSNIIKGFFSAILLSLFLLFEYFNLEHWGLYLFCATLGFVFLLSQSKEIFFWSGFFVGILWFYWISFSFIHYGFWYLLPLGIIGVALVYGILFWFAAIIHTHPFIKGAMFFAITSYIHPFGFNWLDFRLLLLRLPFGLDHLALTLFMGMCASFLLKGFKKLLFLPFLVLLVYLTPPNKPLNILPFSFSLAQTHILQEDKWKEELRASHIKSSFKLIRKAINEKKRMVILPESAFPLYLNRTENVKDILKMYSKKIVIIAGALTYKDKKFYNSTYVFDKQEMKIFHKVILVPFGEEVPLPDFAKKFINYLFYGGAKDFATASKPQDYFIDGVKIRNAICFEATKEKMYENAPKFMVAISNNAWFIPSTEPLLQHLLLKLFASLYGTTIYHSVNGSQSEVINPRH